LFTSQINLISTNPLILYFKKNIFMKKILLAVLTIAICTGAFAQLDEGKRLKFSAGPELGFATADLSNRSSIGLGATAQGEYNVASGTNVTLTTGFMSYVGKSIPSTNTKYTAINIIPIRVGIKYKLVENFYGAAQLGAGIINKNGGGGAAFAYSPLIGYEFDVNAGKTSIDASLKYDGYSKSNANWGSVGIRLAYVF
jgi:hypothetical protein